MFSAELRNDNCPAINSCCCRRRSFPHLLWIFLSRALMKNCFANFSFILDFHDRFVYKSRLTHNTSLRTFLLSFSSQWRKSATSVKLLNVHAIRLTNCWTRQGHARQDFCGRSWSAAKREFLAEALERASIWKYNFLKLDFCFVSYVKMIIMWGRRTESVNTEKEFKWKL